MLHKVTHKDIQRSITVDIKQKQSESKSSEINPKTSSQFSHYPTLFSPKGLFFPLHWLGQGGV